MRQSKNALALMKRTHVYPGNAWVQAWRIENEYPDDLRDAAEAWVEDRPVGDPQAAGRSLSDIRRSTGVSVPDALEFLYVLRHDPESGNLMLGNCTRRDTRR